jgi:hypothetical protein
MRRSADFEKEELHMKEQTILADIAPRQVPFRRGRL